MLSKLYSACLKEHLERKKWNFSETFYFFRISAKKFWQGCRNCFLRVLKYILFQKKFALNKSWLSFRVLGWQKNVNIFTSSWHLPEKCLHTEGMIFLSWYVTTEGIKRREEWEKEALRGVSKCVRVCEVFAMLGKSLTSLLRTLEPENLRRQMILLRLWIKLYRCIASIHNSCSPRCLLGSNGFRHVNSFLTTVSNFDVLISIEMRAVSEAISLVLARLAPQKKNNLQSYEKSTADFSFEQRWFQISKKSTVGETMVSRERLLITWFLVKFRMLGIWKNAARKWCLWIQV